MIVNIEKPKSAEYAKEWVEYKPGVKFLIAELRRPAFGRSLELNNIQVEQEIMGVKEITDDSSLVAQKAFLRSVSFLILDWTGLDMADNTPFKYSKENAVLLCTQSQESLVIVNFVMMHAKRLKEGVQAEREEEVGKSLDITSD
ncbi:hypothetical protein [Acinetobacter sp. HY1485]|uniref:hypothetical protein n=1 Tax=Acinetobacter sp. HY1485 TaxID=2970918 RepID=UPI0022B9BB4D|nr:hypothetical protein [Acinetobacter sp. HY1485]